MLQLRQHGYSVTEILKDHPELRTVGIAFAYRFAAGDERFREFVGPDGSLTGPGFTLTLPPMYSSTAPALLFASREPMGLAPTRSIPRPSLLTGKVEVKPAKAAVPDATAPPTAELPADEVDKTEEITVLADESQDPAPVPAEVAPPPPALSDVGEDHFGALLLRETQRRGPSARTTSEKRETTVVGHDDDMGQLKVNKAAREHPRPCELIPLNHAA